MTLTLWLSLVTVCTLGTISPGPSLAVVLRHNLSNGRSHGILCALSHAAGVALWATLTEWLQKKTATIDKISGITLLGLAIGIVAR